MNALQSAEVAFLREAEWIWSTEPAQPDSYHCFCKLFTAHDSEAEGNLVVSVSGDFVAWVNGVEMGRRQFSDWPERKSYARFRIPKSVLDRNGENRLVLLVFHEGLDSSTYVAAFPGIRLALTVGEAVVVTRGDGSWMTTLHPAFRSGAAERMTIQSGYTFEYDARNATDWHRFPLDENAGWHSAEKVEGVEPDLVPRPLPSLVDHGVAPVSICAQGVYFEGDEAKCEGSIAVKMSRRLLRPLPPWEIFANRDLRARFATLDTDDEGAATEYSGPAPNAGVFLNPIQSGEPLCLTSGLDVAKNSGRYFIVDLGEERVGLLEFEIEAPEGVEIGIAHGEHLNDGRVRMVIGSRRFADRYISRAGRQHFQFPFRRLGARYLEVHIAGSAALRIYSIGLREYCYPESLEQSGTFHTDDPLAMRAWDTALRTLRLCRHEHYEDCPWREQALYAQDGRLQALYGYHAFGDYLFAEVSLRLLAQGYDERLGLLPLTAPGRCPVNIPIFSLAWVAALSEHWLYSGSPVLYSEYSALVEGILRAALARKHKPTGLFLEPPDAWNFYEWVPGLCGRMEGEEGGKTRHLSAGYNLCLHEALRAAASMAHAIGESERAEHWSAIAESLRLAARASFLSTNGYWRTTLPLQDDCGENTFIHEWVQAMAALEWGHEGEKHRGAIREKVVPCMFSSLLTVARVALAGSPEDRRRMVDRLEANWGGMLFSGASTFWETAAGADDFDGAGSLCHGWSALPIWFYQAVVLGVEPLKPGFREFSLKVLPCRLDRAEGAIPTPHGKIHVKWTRSDAGLFIQIDAPPTCTPRVAFYPEATINHVTVNDVQVYPQPAGDTVNDGGD